MGSLLALFVAGPSSKRNWHLSHWPPVIQFIATLLKATADELFASISSISISHWVRLVKPSRFFIAYSRNGQIELSTFEQIDTLIFRLENRLLKLVESLERKRDANDWTETLVVREDPIEYGTDPAVTHDLRILLNGAVE